MTHKELLDALDAFATHFIMFFLYSYPFISIIGINSSVKWEERGPAVCQRAASRRRWSMLADSETKPGDRAGDGSANRGPFIIGVAGGTASGKVGIRLSFRRPACLVSCLWYMDWSLLLEDNLKMEKKTHILKWVLWPLGWNPSVLLWDQSDCVSCSGQYSAFKTSQHVHLPNNTFWSVDMKTGLWDSDVVVVITW